MLLYLDDYNYITSTGKEGYGFPKIDKYHTLVLTTSRYRYNECVSKGIPVQSLSQYLGVSQKGIIESLFSIVNHFFVLEGSDELYSDQVLVRLIYDAFLKEEVPTTYCFCIDTTFCWFNIDENRLSNIHTLTMNATATNYTLGKFANLLRYRIVCSGGSLNKLVFYAYGDFILTDTFANYRDLKYLFDGVRGLANMPLSQVYERLIDKLLFRPELVTAEKLVYALNSKFHTLGIRESNNAIQLRSTYCKNFSECSAGYLPLRCLKYFLVVDCEGVSSSNGSLKNGFREIGLLLCAEYKGKMICRFEFQSDSRLFEDFIESFYQCFKEVTNQSIPRCGLDTFVYGVSDEVMIKGEIEHMTNKKLKGMAERLFDFKDTKYQINKVLDKEGMTAKRTLQNIARHFDVLAVRPKHSAVSDARTLFNILSEINRRELQNG